ncbi:hypothetical protein F5Y04DRAFT_59986 [Hypomontagnella monticulosa]|nr:hypothetical protein F5Y04DRAFT_59986 [Hypomontagnella monticulosa]
MGRLEPLTSLALGRSPYDDVVPGQGEADPHEPEKQYDSTGRIVNPRTKQIIKDVIRAHNEVMLVIGVAEPENGGATAADMDLTRQYYESEADTGRTLYQLGTSLGVLSTWGVLNIRRRILVYKRRADISFIRLMQTEYHRHPYLHLCFAGYPCYMAMHGLRLTSRSLSQFSWDKGYPWCIKMLHGVLEYARFHLHIFLTMQRLDMIPASQLFPELEFFIPFSSSSPFPPPPPLGSLDVASVAGWAGELVANLAPYAAFYLGGCMWQAISSRFRAYIRRHLPRPVLFRRPVSNRAPLSTVTSQRQTVPESPTLGAADREIRHQEPEVDASTSLAVEAQPSGETIPVGSIRRRGTFSSRGGEDYGTDEEDAELVNPTLISFDVDTTESSEPPTGVWSAELRPSPAADPRQQPKEPPLYIVNPLTGLPSSFASDILANFATNILFIPFDAYAFPVLARVLAQRRGLPYDDMCVGGFLGGLTWRGVLNIIQLDVVRLFIIGDVWALTTVLSQWLHMTEEEWKDAHKEQEPEFTDIH